MITEIVGGIFANSLAIMTDAAHLFSDMSGFFISIFSLHLSQMQPDQKMSYGYHRAEVIGSLTSVIIIQGLTIWLVVEAIQRILNPSKINASIMLLVSILGLIFNLSMMKILHSAPGHSHSHGHSHEGHNHEGHSHGHEGHSHSHEKDKNHYHDHNHDHDHDKSHDFKKERDMELKEIRKSVDKS
jgi:solute carrier family 30 (zinc transporter), member 2